MATSLADFAEQINPKTLAEVRRANFRQAALGCIEASWPRLKNGRWSGWPSACRRG